MKDKAFGKWWKELVALARRRGLSWLLSKSPEDHRVGFEDGLTPEEELNEEVSAAADNSQ